MRALLVTLFVTVGTTSVHAQTPEIHYFEDCQMVVRQVDADGGISMSAQPMRLVANGPGGKIYKATIGTKSLLLAHNFGRPVQLGEHDLWLERFEKEI